MSTPRPVAEWRARWEADLPPVTRRRREPRSPWIYLLAAFGGTALALCSCLAIGIGLLVALAGHNGAFDSTPQSLTYVNDTDDDLWLYECLDRCQTYNWVFPLDAGDEQSIGLGWYVEGHPDYLVVIHDDARYGCIPIPDWVDQTIKMSSEQPCPLDIHSPEGNRA
jgi:hypothetical protein